MTDEEILTIYKEMENAYGDKLPCPVQQPLEFEYYVKLFKYYRVRPPQTNDIPSGT